MSVVSEKLNSVLRLRNVGVCFSRRTGFFRRERFWALRDVSFDLHHGESLGIIGRNGAGKSTLLKVLAGILAPDRGHVVCDGLKISLLSLQVGFLPQLTGRENAILSGMLLGLSRRKVEAKMDEIVAFAELEAFIDQPLSTFSAGMKARLGFSVAFQFDPDILLVDEVLGVGDADFRQRSTELMRDRIRSDKTIVLVSHNTAVIRELCNRSVWIDNGETMAEGDPRETLAHYDEYIGKLARDRRVSAPLSCARSP